MSTPRPIPIAVKDTTAAAMLDMSAREFRQLVGRGALPPPVRIGGNERWRVEQLRDMLDGSAARPPEEFEL